MQEQLQNKPTNKQLKKDLRCKERTFVPRIQDILKESVHEWKNRVYVGIKLVGDVPMEPIRQGRFQQPLLPSFRRDSTTGRAT